MLDAEPPELSRKMRRSYVRYSCLHLFETRKNGDDAEPLGTRPYFTSFEEAFRYETKEWIGKQRVGEWYRLLTSAVRLISSLSTDDVNHRWLLEQGALQAVKKILQFLPENRMRSAHQEAALFIYRLYENHR